MEAELTTLTGPPPLLERMVLFCLPPAARETVGGDLCEMYRSPVQYGWQAATALPFVVASQARRCANLPVLGFQGLILFACFDGLFAIANVSHSRSYAAIAAVAGVLFLFIHEAYQEQERPTCHRAILETILLSGAMLLLFPQQLLIFAAVRQTSGIWWPGFALLGCLMAMVPVLCCLRAGLILEVDRRHPPLQDEEMSVRDMPPDYRRFRRLTVWHNQLESVALLVVAVCYGLLGPKIGVPDTMGSGMVIGGFAAAALYLLLDGSGREISTAMDFQSLRALYQYELAHRCQLRRFLWWLWSAPLFLLLYTNLIVPGIVAGRSPDVTFGILAALLLGFFIGALNREGAGPIREKIKLLGKLQEIWAIEIGGIGGDV